MVSWFTLLLIWRIQWVCLYKPTDAWPFYQLRKEFEEVSCHTFYKHRLGMFSQYIAVIPENGWRQFNNECEMFVLIYDRVIVNGHWKFTIFHRTLIKKTWEKWQCYEKSYSLNLIDSWTKSHGYRNEAMHAIGWHMAKEHDYIDKITLTTFFIQMFSSFSTCTNWQYINIV